MTTAALAFPDGTDLWTIREHALAAQQTAVALFRSEQWIWAHKALGRAERFFRKLGDADNPFAVAGNALLGRPTPPPQLARPSRDAAEDLHARLVQQLAILNAARRERAERLLTLRELVEDLGRDYGPVFVADMFEVEARLNPTPTG